MEFTMIRLEKVESVATITLNRPEKMNTYTAAMLSELATVLEDVALDDSIRAVILTGEGRAFCAGADLKEGQGIQKELPENQDIHKLLNRVVLAIRQAPKPFVFTVNKDVIIELPEGAQILCWPAISSWPQKKPGWLKTSLT